MKSYATMFRKNFYADKGFYRLLKLNNIFCSRENRRKKLFFAYAEKRVKNIYRVFQTSNF